MFPSSDSIFMTRVRSRQSEDMNRLAPLMEMPEEQKYLEA